MDTPTISLAKNQCYIDGRWTGDPSLPVTNKATGSIMARVPDCGAAETRQAIAAAQRAFAKWSKLLANTNASFKWGCRIAARLTLLRPEIISRAANLAEWWR